MGAVVGGAQKGPVGDEKDPERSVVERIDRRPPGRGVVGRPGDRRGVRLMHASEDLSYAAQGPAAVTVFVSTNGSYW